jgi:glycosyltransferase involved in cell wall biosynthesis
VTALTVVIPAYNEERGIGAVVSELRGTLGRSGIDAEILVVDDGSDDATADAAVGAGARVLRHRSNRGYGASLKTGIRAAAHDLIAITDADGTYPSEYLPEMFRQLQSADMIVGARIGKSVSIPLVRRPAKWLLNRLANYVSGAHIPDLNSGLRLFRRDVVAQYFAILPDQFSFTTTITMAMHCDHYAVRYISIDYRARTGKSKIVPWDAGSFAILILRTAMLFRPLRVFLPVVGLCLAYGAGKAFLDLVIMRDPNLSATAVLALLAALLILMIGMLGDAMATRFGRLNPNIVVSAAPADVAEVREPAAEPVRRPGV